MMNSGPVRDGAAQAASAASDAPLLKLEDFLPHRLNVLSSLVSQALTRVYGRYGIGIPEWRGLLALAANGGGDGGGGGRPPPIYTTKGPRGGGRPHKHQHLCSAAPPPGPPEPFVCPAPPAP